MKTSIAEEKSTNPLGIASEQPRSNESPAPRSTTPMPTGWKVLAIPDERKPGVSSEYSEREHRASVAASLTVNAKDKDGRTPLWRAAKGGDSDQVRSLIAAGADVNAKYHDGITPLMLAAYAGQADCVAALIGAGADVNAKASEGGTALMNAAYQGHSPCVVALIAASADVNVHDKDGDTALTQAAILGNIECVDALIAAGADVNAHDNNGGTALMTASYKGRSKCVRALITAGAEVNIKNKSGNQAITNAIKNGDIDCIKALVSAGADLTARDRYGDSALRMAASRPDVLAVLQSADTERRKTPAAKDTDVNAKTDKFDNTTESPGLDVNNLRHRIVLLSRYMQACIDAQTDVELAQRGMRLDRSSGSETPEQLSKRLQAALSSSGTEINALADSESELRALGEKINLTGGFELMREIAKGAVQAGGDMTRIDKTWDGVGKWRA